jgi:hypothetical protein
MRAIVFASLLLLAPSPPTEAARRAALSAVHLVLPTTPGSAPRTVRKSPTASSPASST